jgi:tagatose-1,6-bisphosphate aldolase
MNQKIEIFYRTDKTSITEKDRNWIREVVNKVVGSDLPKPV